MPRIPSKPKVYRRANNEGSIYRRKDGKWVGQVTMGYRPDNGKPIRKYTYQNTREEVAHWIALTLSTDLDRETHPHPEDLLLRDFLHNWLVTFKTYEVASCTMEIYYGVERNHIVPALGGAALDSLNTRKIQTFLYQLQSEKHLAHRTISLIRSTLIQMYDYALELNLVTANPARNTKLPRQSRTVEDGDKKVIPIAQRTALLSAAADDPVMCPILTILLFAGMRIGEVLALQWKHINFVQKTITIQQALTRDMTFGRDGKTESCAQTLGSTKTRCSRRMIQAPELVLLRLREWMQYVTKLRGGLEVLVPEGFVFFSTRTMTMRTYSGFRSSYRHFLERHGFDGEGLNLHRFRHTYASMLLEQGVNPKIVQKLLGHRDVSTTLDVYTHVVPEVFSGVTATVNDASQQLLSGTYAPRQSREQIMSQLLALDPLFSEDPEPGFQLT